MAQLTMRQAATAAGVSRQTIYRVADAGRLSVTTNRQGQKVVDTSELIRVFGALQQPGDSPAKDSSNQPRQSRGIAGLDATTTALQIEVATLKAQLDASKAIADNLRDQLAKAEAREGQARADAARMMVMVEKQMLLLEGPKAPTAPQSETTVHQAASILAKSKKPVKAKKRR